jgi:uncharacterized damage-inducible protein DinB
MIVTSETSHVWDLLQRAYEGDAWHGPALRELLENVTSQQAAARPIPGAHTIWELCGHIAVYEDQVRRRLLGESAHDLPEDEAFPKVEDTSPAAWRRTLETFEAGHQALRRALSDFPEERLGECVPGREYPYYLMLHGVVQHDLYHAGQIALLLRAQGVRPQG